MPPEFETFSLILPGILVEPTHKQWVIGAVRFSL